MPSIPKCRSSNDPLGAPAGCPPQVNLRGHRTRLALILAGLGVVVLGVVLILERAGFLQFVSDPEAVRSSVLELGAWGPALVVGLIAAAIVVSPIPSGPIGLAAGAAYGPLIGTLLIIAGAELGSILAFAIARFLAYDAVRKWSAIRRPLEWLETRGSQNWLMSVVFASRLLPFISFDAVSYAAGLTPLTFWRFGVATILGVAPISFVLAYGGDALLTHAGGDVMAWVLGAGAITLIPIVIKLAWDRVRRGGPKDK